MDGERTEESGARTADTRRCPWCSVAAPAGATQCPACGASLAEREDLGGLAIPGVTTVDPELLAASGDGVLRRINRVNARTNLVNTVVPHLALADPMLLGAAAVAGAAAIGLSAVELGSPKDAEGLGRASDSALALAAQLDRGEEAEAPVEGPATDSGPVPPMDPWSDLPPSSVAAQVAGTEFDPSAPAGDPWAARPDPWATEGGPWSSDAGADEDGQPK
jgi:hypothetical protein